MISIIVPVYNAEKYLNRCIDSLLGQTYNDIEVIVVNDGSTDGSKAIIDNYSKKDPRIIAIHKENSGVADARNAGIDAAHGEYIGFIDADDFAEPDMYEKLLKAIIAYNAQMSCCGYYQEFSDYHYEIKPEAKIVLQGAKEIYERYLRQDVRNGIFDGNWNKLIKKSVLEGTTPTNSIRYKKIKYCEDIDFQFRAMGNCDTVVCIPDLLYHYMDNEYSATHKPISKDKASVLEVADNILAHILVKHPEIYEQAYAFHLTWYLSLLQEIYDHERNEDSVRFKKKVARKLKDNYRFYAGNTYSKRLDQYYLRAIRWNMVGLARALRSFVRGIRPSKDRIQ